MGYDGISAEEIYAAASDKGLEMLLDLCRNIWEEEQIPNKITVIPNDWKRAVIVPMYKKKDKMECNKYRGIPSSG